MNKKQFEKQIVNEIILSEALRLGLRVGVVELKGDTFKGR